MRMLIFNFVILIHSLSSPSPLFTRINPGGQVKNTNIYIYHTFAECAESRQYTVNTEAEFLADRSLSHTKARENIGVSGRESKSTL
jgi:hypothetical protein